MGLTTRRKAVLVAQEAAQGQDAIAGGDPATRGSRYGVPAIDAAYSHERANIDRVLMTGDQGRDPTLVGFGQGTHSMGIDLRGAGVPDRVPQGDALMQSCGLKRQRLRRSLFVAGAGVESTPPDPDPLTDNEDLLSPQERLHRGEQIHCETQYSIAGWGTSVISGILQGVGAGTEGQVGDTVEFFPPNGEVGDPSATGIIRQLNSTANRFTVQFDKGQVGRPKSGDFFRVSAPDGTVRGFNVLTQDVPVMVLLDYDTEPQTGILARILYVMESGAEPATFRHLAAQQSGLLMTFGDGEDHGWVYRPTSDQIVEFVVDWGGSPANAIPVDLAEGREFVRRDGLGNETGACIVKSFTNDTSGSTNKSTISAQVTYGTFVGGATLYFVDLLGAQTECTIDLNPAPFQSETPSVTIWHVIDNLLRGLAGCRGNLQLTAESGNPGRINFEHTGLISEKARSIPQPTGISTQGVTPPNWSGGRGEINGKPLRMQSMTFDMGAQVSRRQNANSQEGTEEYAITDRDPNLQLTIGRAGVAAFDIETLELEATWVPAAVILGRSEGNRVAVVVPRGQLMNPSDGDEEGTLTAQIDLMCRRIAGDDDFFLVFR